MKKHKNIGSSFDDFLVEEGTFDECTTSAITKILTHIQSEKFDYTKWRENLFEGLSVNEISKKAMESRKQIKPK